MKIFARIFPLLCAVLFLSDVSADADYYQYRDKQGNLRYTDDISQVPEKQRGAVKHYESIQSRPEKPKREGRKENNRPEPSQTPGEGTWDSEMRKTAEELEQENKQLQETYQELLREKQALDQESPEEMTKSERNAHAQRVRELNARIKVYNERKDAFSEKVDRFNRSTSGRQGPPAGETDQ